LRRWAAIRHRRRLSAASFRAPANREETDVIGIIEGKIITEHLRETIPIVDGDKRPDTGARPRCASP
jgi:adenine deaminase